MLVQEVLLVPLSGQPDMQGVMEQTQQTPGQVVVVAVPEVLVMGEMRQAEPQERVHR
jgi:hypothetical protein